MSIRHHLSSLAILGVVACRAPLNTSATAPPVPVQHTLMPSSSTVAWGNYWAGAAPVLRMHSGERVTIGTLLTNSPTRLAQNGVDSTQIEPALKEVYANVPQSARGPGGHILTGPVYVEEADSGDVLQVDIERVELAIPYSYNGFGPNRGWLPEDFQYARTKIVPLDRERMVGLFAPGIEVPLRPFFGSMGVAPPASMGKINSAPPGLHAGNLDNKDLVAGTTLYIPVWTKGALFEVGDGHAAQGNGEVDITALETSLRGTFRLTVRKDLHFRFPRAETPTHWIAMGIDSSLVVATKQAVREAIDFLVTTKGMSKDDAYMLVSVSSDVNTTQLVDGTLGVHVLIPKRIFTGR